VLSQQERYRDASSMEALALAAVAAAMGLGHRQIDRDRYTAVSKSDFQARSLGELANAYRRNYNFELAEETLCQAQEHLERCRSDDPMTEIRLLDIRASLYLDQRRLTPALDFLDEARKRYLELGETHLAGRALVKKGIASGCALAPQDDRTFFSILARSQGSRASPGPARCVSTSVNSRIRHATIAGEQPSSRSRASIRGRRLSRTKSTSSLVGR
jgi:hypothetical protein